MTGSAENIRFFNTLTRTKERFVPIEKGKVRMYTCGPTVWDYAHIGNFRTFIFEDLLRRWLEYRHFAVTQVMNLTDVDDRTIEASQKAGVPLNEFTMKFVNAFFHDVATLNIEKVEFYPRATEHVPEMVRLIERLVGKGYAYHGEDGSIYYDISKFQDYGHLSKVNVGELKAGARVKVDDYAKEQAQDFALWKAWDHADGNVFWETEVGKGRPGWHIECSAMSMKYLGETLDIHTGGVDNMFPHHENEIAQSEAATGKRFVNYWMHSEHLLVEGKRMGKRFGNYYTVRDLTEKLGHDPRAVRYILMSTHYRQQFNFTFEGLTAAKSTVDRLANFMFRLRDANGSGTKGKADALITNVKSSFEDAMDDDLDIGSALASLFDFIRDVNGLIDSGWISKHEAESVSDIMRSFDGVLGVIGEAEEPREIPEDARKLIEERETARRAKNYARADEIRQELKVMGIILEDTSEGVKWRQERR